MTKQTSRFRVETFDGLIYWIDAASRQEAERKVESKGHPVSRVINLGRSR